MAESLYVCHFSNGHIKVGRSIDPMARIATHADRVACMGVLLVEHFIVECVGPSVPAETALINHCTSATARRFQNEWFADLDFGEVCEAASMYAKQQFHKEPRQTSFGARITAARKAAGLTQAQLGEGLGIDGADMTKATVSGYEVGRNLPNVEQLRLICLRLNVSADSLLGIATPTDNRERA